ncbi:uncharacterized protein LOC120780158 isoform X2 [Bactrocera tryoni]|nr:uncharacterized protein LOC120780158 isoform X2 [Bactrocera tryoni]XP_039968370.1 uncharacterized protein LOC120780158 isoform X2 [Bactrocera tryoni]XP_039968371.1 uncharacterized protein LOC120780158 isoform X2 [Bactrocera tryoni]
MPEKTEVQAEGKNLRECKVLTATTQKFLGRITSNIEDEEYLELSSKIPMSSAEQLLTVETLLKAKMRLLAKAKGHKGSVHGGLRSLFSDELMANYNRRGKFAPFETKVH